MRLALTTVVLSFLASSPLAGAQGPGGGAPAPIMPTDSNIVYGNVANASLLMDIFRPSQPNGIGIIFISGSGWGGIAVFKHEYDDVPIRRGARLNYRYQGELVGGLVARGYTVFSIDHRFIPETPFPGLFYDAQRAVRFIRGNAARYGIDPQKLGAIGHSSGGHLAAMLGVKDTVIDDPKHRPYQQGSSQVQAVVTLAAPLVATEVDPAEMSKFLGPLPPTGTDGTSPAKRAQASASPITFVTARSAPMLIYQSEDDPLVGRSQADLMAARLAEAGVPYRLNMQPTGKHAPTYDIDEIDAWFRRYLK